MRKITIETKIVDGRMTTNRERIQEVFRAFSGERLLITIEKPKKKRSNEQNAYWWGVMVPIWQNALKAAGMSRSKEDTHVLIGDLIRQKYGHSPLHVEIEIDGKIYEERRGTSSLTTSEFNELMSYAQDFAMEVFGVNVPSPNEVQSIE